jgi:hypothetical protein
MGTMLSEEIIGLLDTFAEKNIDAGFNSRVWTKGIKCALCVLGKNKKYMTFASQCDKADNPAWLFDLAWLKYTNSNLMSLELAVESEWLISSKAIDDDFQKLLPCRSEMRLMIFRANTRKRYNEIITVESHA